MAVPKRREAERAVVRAALNAREAIQEAIARTADEASVYLVESSLYLGALLGSIHTLNDLPRRSIDSPDPAARDDATDTSRAAARRVMPRHGTYRCRVFDLVASCSGLTDDELERHADLPHQTVSSARNSLVENGWLRDSGRRRNTINGRPAIIWEAVP